MITNSFVNCALFIANYMYMFDKINKTICIIPTAGDFYVCLFDVMI